MANFADNNTPIEYKCSDGSTYTFYRHFDGFDQTYNCQFCKHIGRVRDVFKCLNESEWRDCYAYKGHAERRPE